MFQDSTAGSSEKEIWMAPGVKVLVMNRAAPAAVLSGGGAAAAAQAEESESGEDEAPLASHGVLAPSAAAGEVYAPGGAFATPPLVSARQAPSAREESEESASEAENGGDWMQAGADVVAMPPSAPPAPTGQGEESEEDEEPAAAERSEDVPVSSMRSPVHEPPSAGEEEDEEMQDSPREEAAAVAATSAPAPAPDAASNGKEAQPDTGAQAQAAGDAEAEDEEEEEEEEAKEGDPVDAGAAALQAAGAAARALVAEPMEEEDDQEEEDPAAAGAAALQAAGAAARALIDEPMEDEEDEEPEEDPAAAGAAALQAAGAAARALIDQPMDEDGEEDDGPSQPVALVPVESAAASAERSESLPLEASGEWTMCGDFCSLQVAGREMRLPRTVYERLYAYQRQGVAWMWNLFHKGFGGILGDEMGLGKTVQTAAFLACLKCTQQACFFLVVVPPTLLEQWKRELSTWARDTGLAVHTYYGGAQDRQKSLRNLRNKGGVLLTTYDLVRTTIVNLRTAGLACAASALPRKRKRQDQRATRDDDSPSEAEENDPHATAAIQGAAADVARPWDVVIVDEAQGLKNPSCVVGRALRKLEARSRLLLTGTPLQNKLSDLWALMDFAQPALLGNHATFERGFSEQIEKGSKKNASRFAVELKDHLARELRRLTAPHFLRRLKSEVTNGTSVKEPVAGVHVDRVSCGSSASSPVLAEGAPTAPTPAELPSKMEVVLWLNLTPAQLELYNLYLGSEIVRRAAGKDKCGMEALRAIGLLKKLCNHPLLCLPPEEFEEWRNRVVLQGGGAADAAAPAAQASSPQAARPFPGRSHEDSLAEDAGSTQPAAECQHVLPRLRALIPGSVHGATLLSCKLRVLSVLLPQLHKRGHRCLIFSQSTRMLDLVQACVLRVLGLKFLRIDGTIDPKDRDLKVNKFQQEGSRYFCMCLSVQTGGTGLTITAADRVILVDPAWNPSVDAQAIDRVHRLGQRKDVVVYRLVGGGAIEDKMFRLQVFKRGLSKIYLEQEQQVRFFTRKELKALFEPPDRSASTQALMAEQIGTEALEHEELLRVVAGDIGSTDDPQALPFWQSSDVLGFSDYQRLFMFLEQAHCEEDKARQQAEALAAKLREEEYVKDQVVEGRWRVSQREAKDEAQSVVKHEAQDSATPLEDLGGA